MGACPVRTINFDNYNIQMISEMINAVEVPDEFEEKPRVLILACENDARGHLAASAQAFRERVQTDGLKAAFKERDEKFGDGMVRVEGPER